jgi:hypothetical protein
MGVEMINNALTLNEAKYLCDAYRYMQGMKLWDDKEVFVERVAISPADDINKWIFLHHYGSGLDAEQALDFYKVPYFDVVLITRCAEGVLSYVGLRTYNDNSILQKVS